MNWEFEQSCRTPLPLGAVGICGTKAPCLFHLQTNLSHIFKQIVFLTTAVRRFLQNHKVIWKLTHFHVDYFTAYLFITLK